MTIMMMITTVGGKQTSIVMDSEAEIIFEAMLFGMLSLTTGNHVGTL